MRFVAIKHRPDGTAETVTYAFASEHGMCCAYDFRTDDGEPMELEPGASVQVSVDLRTGAPVAVEDQLRTSRKSRWRRRQR